MESVITVDEILPLAKITLQQAVTHNRNLTILLLHPHEKQEEETDARTEK